MVSYKIQGSLGQKQKKAIDTLLVQCRDVRLSERNGVIVISGPPGGSLRKVSDKVRLMAKRAAL